LNPNTPNLNRLILHLLVLACWSYLIHQPAHAGAWAQPRGHAYAKVSGIFYHAEDVYNAMGQRQEMGINDDEFAGQQMFLYLEYGLRDRLTLVTQMRAGALTDEDAFVRMKTTGIGDLEAGLKYRLVDQPAVVAPMLSLKIPTGYNAWYDPALGTGKVDVEARLLVSRSFYPLPVYAGLDDRLSAARRSVLESMVMVS
jgi:hypothetical protein